MINDHISMIPPGSGPARRIPLRDHFFSPRSFSDAQMEDCIRGMARTKARDIDVSVADALRSLLFHKVPDLTTIDLAAVNIQRGRDHAVPTYNEARRIFRLEPRTSFSQITTNKGVARTLDKLYRGDVEALDLWVGCLAEDHVPGSSLGELTRAIWISEFARKRDGDRFYYDQPRQFPRMIRRKIFRVRALRRRRNRSTLRAIILRNTDIAPRELPDNLFLVQ